jgi:FkbM family methyltransferase
MSAVFLPHPEPRPAPASKRAMRAAWSVLPRSKLSYDLGKLITRSLLRPEAQPHPVAVRFANLIPMRLDLASFVANDLYCLDDHYESVTLRLWRELAREARVILDIGSHIGTFALVAAAVNPKTSIVAVEADPNNFGLLRDHCATYPNVVPVHAAIADRAGQMWFCPGQENDGAGRLSVERPADGSGFPVQTCSLAELCRQQSIATVDLMKLDVEGFEHTLMATDSDFWKEFPPAHLIVELTCDKNTPQRTEELFRAMERRGYRAQRIQGLYAVPFGKSCDLANWHFWR